MLDLKKNRNEIDFVQLKNKESHLNIIIDKINEFLCIHIENQVNAGADVVQVFDSWAGLIPGQNLYDYCYIPNKKIVEFCRKIKVPVICFPRGIGKKYLDFSKVVTPDCLSLDYETNPKWAQENLKNFPLQGGMDPKMLFKSEKEILDEVDKYLTIFRHNPYIFNLGHGLLPETNPDIIEKIVERVINFK